MNFEKCPKCKLESLAKCSKNKVNKYEVYKEEYLHLKNCVVCGYITLKISELK